MSLGREQGIKLAYFLIKEMTQMKSLLGKLGVILIGLTIFGYAKVWGADWKYLGSNERYQSYLDTGSIILLPENIVRAWTKTVLTDRGVIEIIKELGIKYENSSEVVELSEWDCVKKTYRQLSVTLFSKEGRNMGSSETGDFKIRSEWSLIIPETTIEVIHKELCGKPEIKERMAKQKEAARVLGEKNKKEGEAFLAENKKKEGVTTLPSALQYKVIKAGTGKKPNINHTVTTHYRGTLIDGTEFDSSYRRGQPVSFPVAAVIPGWTEALQLMEKGAKWQLFIPPNLAYGERGAGRDIGPNATLIFEVELISIQEKK
jgi:FKBP-type peptidyl-prolyl cis-trans isomerase